MRKLLSSIFLICAALIISSWVYQTAHHKKSKHKFLVTGSIMQTISYCGGAQPPQQLLDSMNTPKGIPFGKLFVKSGENNKDGRPVIHRITADTNGNFSIYLPAGHYCLMEDWKAKPFKLSVKQNVDSACLKELYHTCDFELDITDKSIHHVRIIFHRPCSYNQPCMINRGSLPPKRLPQ